MNFAEVPHVCQELLLVMAMQGDTMIIMMMMMKVIKLLIIGWRDKLLMTNGDRVRRWSRLVRDFRVCLIALFNFDDITIDMRAYQ